MKRKHGGFLLGKSSDRYMANNPPLYNKSVQLEHATVADTSFQSRYISQQAPLGTSQYYTSPIHRPLPTMDEQSYGTGLSREMIIRIDELKRLANKYPQYCPEGLMQWAIFCCNNDDNRILDDKLEQLRYIDSLANVKF